MSSKPPRPTSSSKRAATPGGSAIERSRRIAAAPALLASDLRRAACSDGIAFRGLVLPRIVRRGIISGRNPSSAGVHFYAYSCRRPRKCFSARIPTKYTFEAYLGIPSENYTENDRSSLGQKSIHLIAKRPNRDLAAEFSGLTSAQDHSESRPD